MATKAPQFLGPDNVLRELFNFTTDVSSRFFNGTMDADTVDMLVSVRGSAFTSSPDVILFDGTSFTIPNPSAYPAGLQLFPGINRVEVKSVLTSGVTTSSGVAEATLSLERDVRSDVLPPTGIFVERQDQTVQINVTGLDDTNVTGYNFYASTEPGGGLVGYHQINITPVISGSTVETDSILGELTVDANVAVDSNGNPASDPLYLHLTGDEESPGGTVFQTDFNQTVEIPYNVTQIKTTIQVNSVQTSTQYSFVHDRRATPSTTNPAIPNADFNTLLDTDPLYYVVSAIYFIDGVEYESSLSPEVAASPLIVTPSVAALPLVSRQQIIRDTVLSIFRSHPELDVKPGAVLRDTFIDPFATEAERIRFIIGFMQAADSFTTLLTIDDPDGSGTSVPVSQSPYKTALKQAFFLNDDTSVQNMIDNAFDQLAARRGVTREPGFRARGSATVYVTKRPTVTQFVPIGQVASTGSVRFRLTSSASLSPTGAGATYNPATGRYSAQVFIQAESPGEAGNVAAGQVKFLVDGPSGVLVSNDAATFGGRNFESNRDLAVRADGVLSGVDAGTYRGYTRTVVDVPGIRQAVIVDAGHALMMRDRNPDNGRHVGGKVDIWVRGDVEATVTDTFAFSFESVISGQFEPVGNIANLRFRAVNTAVSADNPLIEMLNIPTWNLEFVDASTGKVFDLTNVTIESYDTILLDSSYNDTVNVHLTDVFRGSYRFRTSNRYIFNRQPVSEILSLVGTISGTVSSTEYELFQGSDPLELGHSTESGDYLQVIQSTGSTIPSSQPVVVTGESHVLLGGTEYLLSLGTNPYTVHIYNLDRSVEYRGPYHPASLGTKDFTFVAESGSTPLGFLLTSGSRMTVGQTVLVDYEHDENLTVTYISNTLVGVAQNAVDQMRHVTADVLVKESLQVGVNITATVVVRRNQTIAAVDSALRTALARYFGRLNMGQPLRQADVIDVIKSTLGVSYVVVPLTNLTKQDGSQVIREVLVSSLPADYYQSPLLAAGGWSTDLVDIFLLLTPLASGTVDGGGAINDFRGVYKDETPMQIYDAPPNTVGVPLNLTPNGAFIVGNDGIWIPDFSDDATLAAQYPLASPTDLATLRQQLTAGRVLLALPKGTLPSDSSYAVTYVVYGDEGVKNIEPSPTEYLVLGDLGFTYDEDTDYAALLTGGR
jgi:hypothetical protein